MGQRSSLSSPESANPFAIKPMTGARNSTRLNYVPMGLRGRGRAEGISRFASQIVPAGRVSVSLDPVVQFRDRTDALAIGALSAPLAIGAPQFALFARACTVLADLPSLAT